jgi:hypothetical protein
VDKPNFEEGILPRFEILCSLHVRLQVLEEELAQVGEFYTSNTQYGPVERQRPQAIERNKIIDKIDTYSKNLGLILSRATQSKAPNPEADEWG